LFGVSVNGYEQRPVTTSKTFSKHNRVVIVDAKELPKFFRDGS